jgi:dGTPase
LEYKTQVFVNHEGDLYRTRLTHSLEVAQIARTIARALHLHEDLAEAIGLAHDLGHTPFGHAGQDALNACMKDYGGFEHNLQSLRVVDELEEKYAAFSGLNLSFETREGILKHCRLPKARELGELGRRFLEGRQPSLEAQVTNLADEIAYNSHDVDDGLRSKLICIEQLVELPLFGEPYREVIDTYPNLTDRRIVHEVVRRIIDRQVTDLVQTSSARIASAAPANVEAARACSEPLIGFGSAMMEWNRQLKRFLRTRLYRHYRVCRRSLKSRKIVSGLFGAFVEDPRLMPEESRRRARRLETAQGEAGRAQAVADYIAGMTDRFAIREYRQVLDPAV